MTVTDLTTTDATLSLSLSRTERWEVIMQQETLVALVEHVIHEFLIELGTQGDRCQRLCLTTGEDRASMRHGQWRHLTPDRTDLVSLTTIETDTLIEDATTHGVTLHIMIVTLHHGIFLLQLIFCQVSMLGSIFLLEVIEDLLESLGTSMLLESLLRHVIGGLVQLLVHTLTQLLIVDLVVVLTLHIHTQLLAQLGL